MNTLGNILWFVFFGWWNCIVYGLLGFLFCFTIVGIPIGKACFQYAKLMLAPFGKVIVKETFIKGKENVSIIRRVCGVIVNLLWLPVGIGLLLGSIAEMLICCLTIILIPYAVVIAKSCKFLIWPIGAKVITKDEKQAILIAKYSK